MRPIVFLHIPKTAGQTIHHALAEMVGKQNVSPVRVNEQAINGNALPPGYLLHSGHLNWTNLESVEGDPFVFSVLRDPVERIGSFYFYMRKTAQQASATELKARPGLRRMLEMSADDYFFAGDDKWQLFIRDMYFNFYCSYFATRLVSGRRTLFGLKPAVILECALQGAAVPDRICRVDNLCELEDDIERIYGTRIRIAGRYTNAGDRPRHERRWDRLCARFEKDASIRRLEGFVTEDLKLMERLTVTGRLPPSPLAPSAAAPHTQT